MAKQTTELKQNKSEFKFIGKVTNADKDGFYLESVADRGEREGETRRSMRFGVRTSETNTLTVQMFSYEPNEVFLWNSDKKKKDSSYKGDRVPYQDWVDNMDDYREKGYTCLQAKVGLTYGEDGKLISNGVPEYLMAELLSEGLTNGDYVVAEGEIRYSKYKDKNDKWQEQVQYALKKLHRAKEEDFDGENFEEVNYFEQEFVFVGAELDKTEGKVYVTGRVIDYRKKWYDKQFEIAYKNLDGEIDEDLKELGDSFLKQVKFGDLLKVWGNAVNRVIVSENEEDEAEKEDKKKSNILLGLGKKQPKHAEKFVSKTYVQGLQIQGALDYEKKVYKESDFPNQELIQEESKSSGTGLGGKKKNPFKDIDVKTSNESDQVDENDIEDDDLPF